MNAPQRPDAAPRAGGPPRIAMARRALVGTTWAAAWMLAWGGAVMMFPGGARAQSLSLAVSGRPVALPTCVATAPELLVTTASAARPDIAVIAAACAWSNQD